MAALLVAATVARGIVLQAAVPTTNAASKPTTAQQKVPPPRAVTGGENGKPLLYLVDARGDRLPDYSYAGYRAGAAAIPDARVRVVVSPVAGDNTARIQTAIDHVAALPVDARGLRGAVLLTAGRFEVAGAVRIAASGIVLRGSGAGDDGTLLVATGLDRRTLVTVAGVDDRRIATPEPLAAEYLPVNATRVRTARPTSLRAGDRVILTRPCTAEWIDAIGMTSMGGDRHGGSWKAGTRELKWDRVVVAVEGDAVTLDAPFTVAIDPQFGVGTIAKYVWPGRLSEVGVENLRCRSEFAAGRPKDEEHAWVGVSFDGVEDGWVRRVTFEHFVSGAVWLFDGVRRATVEDCKSLAPVSEIAGHRRTTFFTSGQQTLFQRCHSEEGLHDFAAGFCAAGPNAFVQCWADRAYGDSGPIDSLAAGTLYDNVRIDGNALSLYDRSYRNFNAGWSSANGMLWQCSAAVINCYSPPTARNWAYGCWATFSGDGEWASSNARVRPGSLYYAQLADRIGPDALARTELMGADNVEPSGTRTPQQQRRLLAFAAEPERSLAQWIDDVAARRPIPTDVGGAASTDTLTSASTRPTDGDRGAFALSVRNGWLVLGNRVAVGGRQPIRWWNGGVRPHDVAAAAKMPPNPTRFVPGRVGRGVTDDLAQLADDMLADGKAALEFHYGLWYDVRNVDHERVRRMDADVAAPFYEMPFARSGRDTAWDGLSKYDLTTYNPWYFGRLRSFAAIGAQSGALLLNQHFFQHNLLEAGAHWSSSPWRPANNVNATGFPEPPAYVGDKYVLLAEQFYDVSNPVRRALYRSYIRHQLDALAHTPNVIHLTSEEFQGPLAFVEFWLDVIDEWSREAGRRPLVGLSATKDVQDAILADPVRSKVVSVIDIKYWWYRADGEAFAPPGGVNRAPRSWGIPMRRETAFAPTVRAVREYRLKYPDKAVIHAGGGGWASVMGGGSLCGLSALDPTLAATLVEMSPIALPGEPDECWALGAAGKGVVVFNATREPARVDLSDSPGGHDLISIEAATGTVGPLVGRVEGGGVVTLPTPTQSPQVLWVRRGDR